MSRRTRIALWTVAIALPVAVAAAWVLLFSPWLSIDEVVVTVEGEVPASAGPLDPAEVAALAAVPRGSGLLRLSTPAVADRVAGMPQVASVDVSREFPGTVRITVTRRIPVAAVRAEGALDLLDADGVRVTTTATPPGDLPEVEVPGDLVLDALAVAASLPEWVRERTATIRGSTRNDLTLVLVDGTVVRWGSAADGETKGRVLAALLDEPGAQRWAFVDVSAPGVPATSETIPGTVPATVAETVPETMPETVPAG